MHGNKEQAVRIIRGHCHVGTMFTQVNFSARYAKCTMPKLTVCCEISPN